MSQGPPQRQNADDLLDLLHAAIGGSADAVGRLLDRHRDYLLLIANEELTRTGNQTHSPSDIVQRTQMEVWRDIRAFHGTSVAEFRSWLRRILLNNLADNRRHVRPAKVELTGDPPADDASPSEHASADEVSQLLRKFILSLPPDEQRLVELRYFEGKSYADIAAVIGRTPEATRKLWTRTLARLQEKMRRHS